MVHHPEQLVHPVKAQAKTLQIHSKKIRRIVSTNKTDGGPAPSQGSPPCCQFVFENTTRLGIFRDH
jgi:hypothetical protein